MKRKTPLPETYNPDPVTIYVVLTLNFNTKENISEGTTHESLEEYFSKVGSVAYISLPKFEDKKLKGFAFVEFQ